MNPKGGFIDVHALIGSVSLKNNLTIGQMYEISHELVMMLLYDKNHNCKRRKLIVSWSSFLFLVCFSLGTKALGFAQSLTQSNLPFVSSLLICLPFLEITIRLFFLFMVRLTFNSLFFHFSTLVFKQNKMSVVYLNFYFIKNRP